MEKKSKQTQQPRRSVRVKMAAKAKTRFNKDLPVVLLKRAFTFLSVRSIDGSVKCCKDWNAILTDPNEWSQQWDDDTKLSLSVVRVPNDFSTLQKAINAIGMLDESQHWFDSLVQIPHVIILDPECKHGEEQDGDGYEEYDNILIGYQEFTFSKGLTITGPPDLRPSYVEPTQCDPECEEVHSEKICSGCKRWEKKKWIRDRVLPEISAKIIINTPNAIIIRSLECSYIRVKNGSDVEIEECNLSMNYKNVDGFWGLYVENSICKVTDCNFQHWMDCDDHPQGAAIIARSSKESSQFWSSQSFDRSSVELNGTGSFDNNDVHLLAIGNSEIVIKSRGISFAEIELGVMQADETIIDKQQMYCSRGDGKISTLFDGEEKKDLATEDPWDDDYY